MSHEFRALAASQRRDRSVCGSRSKVGLVRVLYHAAPFIVCGAVLTVTRNFIWGVLQGLYFILTGGP